MYLMLLQVFAAFLGLALQAQAASDRPPTAPIAAHSGMMMQSTNSPLDMPDCCVMEDGVMVMQGIPTWMASGGVILIILLSHWLVRRGDVRPRAAPYRRVAISRNRFVARLLRWPASPFLMQAVPVALFLLVMAAGLFGNQQVNIAPVLTWTWWWALLIFLVLGFGQTFCMICPWEGIATLVTALSLKSRRKVLGYEKPWPLWARNVLPALGLFIVLTWFELGRNVTHSPSMTAILALFMVAMAVLCAILFEKRAFCRYGCLVGRITGLYAQFSPVELRPVSKDVCHACRTKDCVNGNEKATGCPTGLFPGHLKENTYCTLCTECIRACPHDNLAVNLRAPAKDLLRKDRFQADEALLAVVLLALTSFHGFTMTPLWNRLNGVLRAETGWGPTVVFSLLMAVLIVLPWGLCRFTAVAAARFTRPTGVPARRIFRAFACSLVPIALFYHLAHNSMHFFMEAGALIPLLSDPFGWGWDLFGTAGRQYGEWLSLPTIWWIQLGCIVTGHVYGVLVAERMAARLFPERRMAVRSLIPLLITMVLFSAYSVWLISQPMEMRTAM